MKQLLSYAMVACVILVTGCGGGGEPEQAAPSGEQVTIVFENQMLADATLYYVSVGGPRRRIGRVTGNSSGRFRVNADPAGFTIVAEFLGGRTRQSDVIRALPGSVVAVTAMTTGSISHTVRR